jgi:putative transposase
MVKQEYPHFNPTKYNLQVKISSVKTSSHCKHNLNYHIIWIQKYRKKILTGQVVEVLKAIINGQCEDMGLGVLALEVMPDHIHLFVDARPTHVPCEIVKQLKGNTARQLRLVFKDLQFLGFQKRYKSFPNLWAVGYYIGSAGHVSQDAVKRYILEQQGKDVFEYNVYGGDGKQKIGDFTQKLDKWVGGSRTSSQH